MNRNGSHQDETFGGSCLDQLGTLLPGDVIELWGESPGIVKTVFVCREGVGDQSFEWRWLLLDDGSLIEASPDGRFRYKEHRIVKQGSDLYEELVAQDGALVRFEERVRTETSRRRPVLLTIDERQYRISSTGTVGVQRFGEEPELISWKSFHSNPDENVYFGLVDTADENNVGLGLWTVHVCLSFGRPLEETDVTGIYRKDGR